MRITSKGQVTIPQEIRNRLGLLAAYEGGVRVGRGSRPHSAKGGGMLRREIWVDRSHRVVRYNLAYINHLIYAG